MRQTVVDTSLGRAVNVPVEERGGMENEVSNWKRCQWGSLQAADF